jgi:acetyl-CoA acyltransferase
MALGGALERVPQLERAVIDDVIVGCAHPEGEQGWNVARWALLRAGLPVEVPGVTVNRFCASGLEAIALATDRIAAGRARAVLAGGTESMSMIPIGGLKPSPNPHFVENYPEAYMTMGLTAERVAEKFSIGREAQDAYALESHRRAVAAQAAGKFESEIVPVAVTTAKLAARRGRVESTEGVMSRDEGPRSDTSAETLARLRPAFRAQGTVTAGNASPTSDGAAACVVLDAQLARTLGAQPMARMASYAVTGCLPEEMGIGPVTAIPKALKLAGLSLAQIDLIELNEAFAAQALAVMRALDLDPERTNVNGGAIALGHPLGATGSKLTATLLAEMPRRKARYGLVAMCVGSGMGAAAVFEWLG